MEYNWLGVAFVSDKVPDCAAVESVLEDKMSELLSEAQEKFTEFLDQMGLEQVMGVIVPKGSVK